MINKGTEEFQKDMKDFDMLLKQLHAEFNQHLIGNLQTPPNFHIAQARKLVRKYAADRTLKGMQRFQYFNLVAKFNTMLEFYYRRLRDKEEGRKTRFGLVKQEAEQQATAGTPAGADAPLEDKGHLIADASKQRVTLKKMYETWVEFSSKLNSSSSIDFDKFQQIITRKTERLIDEKKCRAIQYKLTVQDGKIKIQAKPVK
jgi:hypothetical protein